MFVSASLLMAFVGQPEGKKGHGKPRRRYEDNIKKVLKYDVRVLWTG
jgi:hypothetical protein